MKKIKPLITAIIGCIIAITAFGQSEDLANRYNDAYRKYLGASCPIEKDGIRHFVYFSRDRELIRDHAFLKIQRFEGAQIMYAWEQLEPVKGQYNFSIIQDDYEYLKAHGKKLFIQLQDVTFNPNYVAVPAYLRAQEFDGGTTPQYNDDGAPEGWVAKRWNTKVQARFALLLEALGKAFDGKIEGINLQETAIGVDAENDAIFSPEIYAQSIKTNMLALKKAFPKATTMQYANFMPGEWLPYDDKGYLRSVYKYGQEIGVGLAGPDLMVRRKGQLNHTIALMHENEFTVPLGIAIQDGNYIGITGADRDYNAKIDEERGRENIVPLLHAFARDFMHVRYMFWVFQEPYFSEDLVPCFSGKY